MKKIIYTLTKSLFGKKEGKNISYYNFTDIKESEETIKNGKRDGLYIGWYKNNGQRRFKVPYKNGKQVGVDYHWYEGGQKESKGTWKNGKENGVFTEWYEDGQKESEEIWKDGKRIGLSTSWYKNGQRKEEGTYKDGEQDGLFTSWWKNGQKRFKVTYKDGETISEKVVWNEDGSLNIPVDFKTLIEKDGLLYEVNSETPYNGQIFNFHEKGLKGNFKDGKPDGLMTYWDKNDGKMYKGNYLNHERKYIDESSLNGSYIFFLETRLQHINMKNGEKDGLYTSWYENGQKEGEVTYKDGEIISVKRWNEDGSVKE